MATVSAYVVELRRGARTHPIRAHRAIAIAVLGACACACARPAPTGICGDGIVNAAGEECDDGNVTSGDGCNATCMSETAGACGDGVCNLAVESCASCPVDCALAPACVNCGDATCDLAGGESCLGCPGDCASDPSCGGGPVCGDGSCDLGAGETCTSCPGDCASDPSCLPPPPMCGDAALDPTETCDGTLLGGETCLTMGFAGGVLACTPSCDGYDASGCIPAGPSVPAAPGDLVVTEIMRNPAAVTDALGEWVEIFNPTTTDFELMGLVVHDDGTDTFTIAASLVIGSGGYLVLGANGDAVTNGGMIVDYVYAGFVFANMADEIQIDSGATMIDRVAYSNATFPTAAGAAMSLSPTATTAVANDAGANWCAAATPYGSGDTGTPGAANPSCP